ncbi:MAG: ABC transporter ATP-binding protein [Candidatus Caenarcaniphilales bacterium]|nr:ABC transporter ATP-binding protein [Candidatus Caenarcaniphilales bacterium]
MIEFQKVTKKFNDSYALKEINLNFDGNKTTVLIGSSGCGKSTILKLISGLLSPDSGQIKFNGEELNPVSLREIRRKIGFVIQGGGLFPHLTAKENVILMAKELRKTKKEIQAKLEELLETCHFKKDFLGHYPSELSGGQIQRVALIRSLMLDPKVLLLDEPLGALDPVIRSSLQEELRETFRQLRKTVIFVTHDMAEAEFFGDNIILMKRGEIVQLGTIKEIISNPKNDYVSEFLNSQRSTTW